MNVQKDLEYYRKKIIRGKQEAQQLNEEAERWREIAMSPGSVRISDVKVQQSALYGKMENAICKAADLEYMQLPKIIEECQGIQREVKEFLMENLDGVMLDVMVGYYVWCLENWSDVAKNLNKSRWQIQRLHVKALNILSSGG